MDLNKDQAEAIFDKKAEQASDAKAAWMEYEEKSRAIRERTAQLRSLRLAKEAAEKNRPVKRNRSRS